MGRYLASSFRAAIPTHSGSIVLLLDDDESFRNALAENLRDDGYEVIECAAANDVPPSAILDDVEIVVTDYDMPGIDGLSFADTFHATHPAVPIIIVTGACDGHLEAQAAARGFVSLLQKPLEYDKLHRLLPRHPAYAPR